MRQIQIETATVVKLGSTDGYRYLAFQPPLDELERRSLFRMTMFSVGTILDVAGPQEEACTMLQYSTDTHSGIGYPDTLLALAKGITSCLQRYKQYVISEKVIPMGWGNSSPFNPNPEQNIVN